MTKLLYLINGGFMTKSKYIFKISFFEVQDEAEQYIGRKLTAEELDKVKKGIE